MEGFGANLLLAAAPRAFFHWMLVFHPLCDFIECIVGAFATEESFPNKQDDKTESPNDDTNRLPNLNAALQSWCDGSDAERKKQQ